MYYRCHEITLLGTCYKSDLNIDHKEMGDMKSGFGFLVCDVVRDYAENIVVNAKDWKHDAEFSGFIRNKTTGTLNFICRRNFSIISDPFIDQYRFCHLTCLEETKFSHKPCENCMHHWKSFL